MQERNHNSCPFFLQACFKLKNIKNSKGFTTENMIEKFQTTLSDFIENKFSNILFEDYNDIKLYFVSNKEIYKRDLGLKMETLINVKFKYKGKILMIRPFMPTPTIPTKPICKIDQRANSSHSGNN